MEDGFLSVSGLQFLILSYSSVEIKFLLVLLEVTRELLLTELFCEPKSKRELGVEFICEFSWINP